MPVWRDAWAGEPPNVLVISETPATEQGTIEDALLFVLDECGSDQYVTDEHGTPCVLALPAEACAGTFFCAGIDLEIQEVQND